MKVSIYAPERVWWKPADRHERTWLTVAFLWAIFTFLMMPYLHFFGKQNPVGDSRRVTADEYRAMYEEFVARYKVGEEDGRPVVEPPPGSDVYILGRQFQWDPVLRLKKGESYRFHLSSLDVQHGFSLLPVNMNFQVLPGWEYILTFTPTRAGDYGLICNEFCGAGHHVMTGRIRVTE